MIPQELPEYVPPGEWPAEAWEELLDRFFHKTIYTDEYQYVLLRIPAEEFDRLAATMGSQEE